MKQKTLRKYLPLVLCAVLVVAGAKLTQTPNITAPVPEAEETLAEGIDVLVNDTFTEDELPEGVEFMEFETLSQEELDQLDWTEVDEYFERQDELERIIQAEPVFTINYGSKTYIDWHVDYLESAFTSRFDLTAGQYVNMNMTYRPSTASATAGYVDTDLKVHTFNFNNYKCTATWKAAKTGKYRVCVINRSKKVVTVSGWYRKSVK